MNNFPIGDKPSSKGPMLGTIIIVILIIIGGIYIVSSRRSGETPVPPPVNEESGTPGGVPAETNVVPTADTQAAALTGLDAVQSDLTASEADMKSLETEIK